MISLKKTRELVKSWKVFALLLTRDGQREYSLKTPRYKNFLNRLSRKIFQTPLDTDSKRRTINWIYSELIVNLTGFNYNFAKLTLIQRD